jgi:hypothetical protein
MCGTNNGRSADADAHKEHKQQLQIVQKQVEVACDRARLNQRAQGLQSGNGRLGKVHEDAETERHEQHNGQ